MRSNVDHEQEIRLKLEATELNAIIMELDILHRAIAPEIVEFYGAFFVESCVYYCMEFMDAGSLDRLVGTGVPEDVLARISSRIVRGLKFLKDDLQVIHRGVSSVLGLYSSLTVSFRRQTYECPGQLQRRGETMRLRRFWQT